VSKARDLAAQHFGKNSIQYARVSHNNARSLQVAGQYDAAERMYQESMAIYKNLGKVDSGYVGDLDNLAILYMDMGRFGESEVLLLEALQLNEQIYGKQTTNYAWILNNLAMLYEDIGQDSRAEKYYLESLEIIEKSAGKNNVYYAAGLNALGGFYDEKEEFDKAERLYLEALQIRETITGKNDADYAGTLNNLAILYWNMGKKDKVEALVLEAFQIQQKLSGNEDGIAFMLANLASYYHEVGAFDMAESKYLAALQIQETLLGKNNPEYLLTLKNCALLYWGTKQYNKAAPLFAELNRQNRQRALDDAGFLSEAEMAVYLDQFTLGAEIALSFLSASPRKNTELVSTLLDNNLFYKGFLQSNARLMVQKMTTAPQHTRNTFAQWRALRQKLAAEYLKPIGQRQQVELAEEEARLLEKELLRSVDNFALNRRQIAWTEVRDRLKTGEAAVEFVHFRYHDQWNQPIDSFFYAAFVILPGKAKPRFINLFEEKKLARLFESTETRSESVNVLYATRSGVLVDKAPAHGDDLYNLIWKPLKSALRGAKTVYYSPSGLLHRVNLAALPTGPKDKILADRHVLRLLSSTRNLIINTPHSNPAHYSAALFGGIQYDCDSSSLADARPAIVSIDTAGNGFFTGVNMGRDGSIAFDALPGTQSEVNQIEALLRAAGIQATTFSSTAGTEEQIKSLGRDTIKSPDILHIATHGFFFDDPEQQKEKQSGDNNYFSWNKNPLFRSGLAFAGANHVWTGGKPWANLEDGICTAYEISHLNLSNTKLVVLSACETGLGDIKGSEGVYGLQRAFKMAGADYLMVSLWQVPDKETAEFMEVFYKSWLGGMTIQEAFDVAREKMRKTYKEPYKWAAWVLVE
jgi:CHAT domain-containing protein/tetratricopeptide (TPR) repeat protein